MTHDNRPFDSRRGLREAEDELKRVRPKMIEVRDAYDDQDVSAEVSDFRKLQAYMRLLPKFVNMVYFWPHDEAGETLSSDFVSLEKVSAVVVSRGLQSLEGEMPGLVNISTFVQSRKTGNIHIGESSWVNEPENSELLRSAGRLVNVLTKEALEPAGLVQAVLFMFQRLIDQTLTLTDSAGQAELPFIDIPVAKDGSTMVLWSNSEAFKRHLSSVVLGQDWGVDIKGLELTAPAVGTVKVTSAGVEFTAKGVMKVFHTEEVQAAIKAHIYKFFGTKDYSLWVQPAFPVGHVSTVDVGDTLWIPKYLPFGGKKSVALGDKLMNKLERAVPDELESGRLYRGFCFWAALTKLKWIEDTAYLDGRYVSGKTKPRISVDGSQLMTMHYGGMFSLTNNPPGRVDGKYLSVEEKKRKRAEWKLTELVLIDLNNAAQAEVIKVAARQRKEAEKYSTRAVEAFRGKSGRKQLQRPRKLTLEELKLELAKKAALQAEVTTVQADDVEVLEAPDSPEFPLSVGELPATAISLTADDSRKETAEQSAVV